MNNNVVWTNPPIAKKEDVKTLSKSLNHLDFSLSQILINRRIHSFELAKSFFRPSLDKLHDPMLMKDMKRAINRIKQAVEQQEKILIYGDYDVDGTTSVALVYNVLKTLYPNLDIQYYIPNRYSEGYGISEKSVHFAKEQNITLVITLDCGIKALKQIDLARSIGIDYIICDHHQPAIDLPKAYAILNPKQKDCNYPFDGLSGCGVGFKLLQGYFQFFSIDTNPLFAQLDLVCISTCADIVPMVDENRIFTYFGLQLINQFPKKSIKALLGHTVSAVVVKDLVFNIAPKINACGRILSGEKAVEMLIEEKDTNIEIFNQEIINYNEERRALDQTITQEALSLINQPNSYSTVLYKEGWHKGVIGIVASRVIEHHYKPTIIFTIKNGVATGSARSIEGFNVYEALNQCSHLFDNFGGHKAAAGITIKSSKLDLFKKEFEQVVKNMIRPEHMHPQIHIDAEISLNQINKKFYSVLSQFAPFGPGNMTPVFVSRNIVSKTHKVLKNKHLKFRASSHNSVAFDCIGFNLYEKTSLLTHPIDIVYKIEENHWQGKNTLQLNILDIKIS